MCSSILPGLQPLFRTLRCISPLPLILTHSYTIPFLFLLGTWSCANSFYGNLVCTFGYTLESEIWDTETFRNQRQSWLSQIVEHIILLQNPTTVKGWFESLSNSSSVCFILTKINFLNPFMHLNISYQNSTDYYVWVVFRNECTKTGGPMIIFQNNCNMQVKWHLAEMFYFITLLNCLLNLLTPSQII